MNIIINATAAKSSGGLSILKDFITFIVNSEINNKNQYYFFTCINEFDFLTEDNCKNIVIHKVIEKNWISRIIWDEGGLHRYCKKYNINPDLIISMQNTCTRFKNMTQLVYYHQPLPIVMYHWNVFKKEEFKLFLYTHFYSYFVKRNSKNASYVVQLPYIKKQFLKKFTRVAEEKILVIRPNSPLINSKLIKKISLIDKMFTFFYPATSLSYKNHSVLVNALCLLKENNSDSLSKVQILFTVEKLDDELMKKIAKYHLEDVIKFIGSVSYTEMLSYYNSVQALLFPSRIETFGLPLLEATSFGLPILASRLPYAEEVLVEYKNKLFLDPLNFQEWANAIQQFVKFETNRPEVQIDKTNTWKYFLDYANLLISRR